MATPWVPPPPPRRPSRWPLAIALGLLAALVAAALWLAIHVVLLLGPNSDDLRPRPSPDAYGTSREIGTRGDPPNPGALYRHQYPSDADTQERRVGNPARLSGYTTWIGRVERVPAREVVDGYDGWFLRVRVRIFNRDRVSQAAGARDFSVWHADRYRRPDVVDARLLPGTLELRSGGNLRGSVYFYVGRTTGDVFVRYHPAYDILGSGNAVWRVPTTS